MSDDMVRLIRQVIRQELIPMIMGTMVSNESPISSTAQRYSIEPPRSGLRSVLPYGVATRAPAGTGAFIAPAGNDTTNQQILGHFDQARPTVQDGEVALYNAYGQFVYLSSGKVQLGTQSGSDNLVLGPKLIQMLSQLMDLLSQHTHAGPGVPPTNAASFEQLKASPVGDGTMLSKVSFTS